MRQETVGGCLGELMAHSANVLVRVEAQETGDVNSPDWEITLASHAVMLQQASAREQQLAQERAGYPQPLTHLAHCEDREELGIGARIVITHVKTETGRWRVWPADQIARRYLIVGRRDLSGIPEPTQQIRLELHQISATRGRG